MLDVLPVWLVLCLPNPVRSEHLMKVVWHTITTMSKFWQRYCKVFSWNSTENPECLRRILNVLWSKWAILYRFRSNWVR